MGFNSGFKGLILVKEEDWRNRE